MKKLTTMGAALMLGLVLLTPASVQGKEPEAEVEVTGQQENIVEADTDSSGGFTYQNNPDIPGTVVITAYTGPDTGSLTIPDMLGGKYVSKIASEVFYDREFSGTLKFPAKLQVIGGNAFAGCSGFTGLLDIPDSVTYIDGFAFDGCKGFTGLNLPAGLQELGDSVFQNCKGMTGALVIPDAVQYLGSCVFNNCEGFTSLTLPSNLKEIGHTAFSNCTGIASPLVIPDGVTSIGSNAFYSCYNMPSIRIGSGVKSIEKRAFYYCTGVESLALGSAIETIGEEAFMGCGMSGTLTLPATVTSIGADAFRICGNITGLSLSPNLTYIGDHAFSGCSNLSGTLTIPAGLIEIGENAFYYDLKISKIVNNTDIKILASQFIENENDYFVDGSGKKIDINGSIGRGEYVKKTVIVVTGVTLDTTSTSIYVGNTVALHATVLPADAANKAVTWSTSNVAVANVSSSGVVTGVSSGIVTITVKTADGGKTATCSVTVIDPTPSPTIVNTVTNTEKGLTISYNTSPNADGYSIYRSDNGGAYIQIASVAGTTFTDNTASKNGQRYSYVVYAYRVINGKTYTSSASPAVTSYRLSKIKVNSVKNSSKKALTVKWSKNSKGKGYQIQYSTSKSFKSTKTITIKSAKTTSKKISGLKKGKTYYVRIRPYKTAGGTKYYGTWTKYSKGVKVKK